MPIPAVIVAAAQNYRYNDDALVKSVSDLLPQEWLRRPSENTNHIAWIVGHMAWARRRLLERIGEQWPRPDLDLYGRGSKLQPDSAYPSPASLLDTWSESGRMLATAFEIVSADLLAQPAPQGPPSADGKVSGVVNFLAIHETYHLGQASYLRSWLGHAGFMG